MIMITTLKMKTIFRLSVLPEAGFRVLKLSSFILQKYSKPEVVYLTTKITKYRFRNLDNLL